jgi:O-antigen ligase
VGTTVALVAAGLGGVLVAPFTRPTVLFALALAGTVVSGNAGQLGLPLSPDRLLVVAGLASLVLGLAVRPPRDDVRRLRAVDCLLLATAAVGVVSAVAARSLDDSVALFGLLDRLGIVPFLGFVLADRLFGTERDRLLLVKVMVGVGAYLAATALAEAAGLRSLVFPRYILDESIGTHVDRARGPFLEAAANGLALFQCGVAAVIGAQAFATRLTRFASAAVAVGCAVGVVATVTRAAWLGAAVGALVGLLLDPRGRRRLPALAAAGVVVVGLSLVAVPGLGDQASGRSDAERPVWDRLNTNAAAVRVVEDHPLTGVGWGRFESVSPEYLRQADDRPLTGARIGVHNVLLSHAAELGLLGATVWAAAVAAAVGAAWRWGRALDPMWRAGAMAIVANWVVVGMFGPLSYAFANLTVWLWLGLAAAPGAREPVRAPVPAPSAALVAA